MAVHPHELGFDSAYFDLPRVRLHAATAGEQGRPLVILLHGFPEAWVSFEKQLGPLAAAGYRVVAPDQRGYNLSSKTGPFDLDTLANDVIRLMDACGARQAHWVGHDWGGVVAWHLAERFPQHVRTLAILNVPHPAVSVRSVLKGNVRQFLRSAYVYFFQIPWLPEWLLRRRGYRLMRRSMQASARPGTFTEPALNRYTQLWSEPGALSAMLGWYRSFLRRAPLAYRPGYQPPRYGMPALLLWGERDAALEVSLAEASARLLERGRLVRFPEVSHWIQHEEPEQVTAHLLALFAQAPGT